MYKLNSNEFVILQCNQVMILFFYSLFISLNQLTCKSNYIKMKDLLSVKLEQSTLYFDKCLFDITVLYDIL